MLSNKQVRQHLLCSSCETRFSKNEDKIERLTRRNDSKQKIFEKLEYVPTETGQLYKLEPEPAEHLAYFATSVIWRAHAMRKSCELGPYGPKFQAFLLGQDEFPVDAALGLMIIEPNELGLDPRSWLTQPATVRVDHFQIHGFIASGLVFRLLVGKRIPAILRLGCLAKTVGPRDIHVRPWNECQDALGAVRLLAQTTPRGKLAR